MAVHALRRKADAEGIIGHPCTSLDHDGRAPDGEWRQAALPAAQDLAGRRPEPNRTANRLIFRFISALLTHS
jgi:hypothetical protein